MTNGARSHGHGKKNATTKGKKAASPKTSAAAKMSGAVTAPRKSGK